MRFSETTSLPTASAIRRTWRLRPSRRVISIPRFPARRTRAGASRPVVELDALAKPRDLRLGRRLSERRPVGALDPVARMREPVRQLAVVREQDEPGRVRVEAPDRVEPALRRHEVRHGLALARLARGRDDVERLVEDPDLARLGPDRLALDLDAALLVDVARRIVTTSPPTVTTPDAISASERRREATPAWARYLARRIGRR